MSRMTPEELKRRTRAFAVAIIKFVQQLPTDPVTVVIVRQ
jgi:hypothetical protein